MKYLIKHYFIIILMVLITASCDMFLAGSYPYTEDYEIPMSEDMTIKAIQNFKKQNPQYCVPDSLNIVDGRDDNNANEYWYHVWFYYPKEQQIVYAWTRPLTKKSTTFGFVGVIEDLKMWHFKRINKDFDSEEDEAQKKKFEERIVKKICPLILNPRD